MLQENANLAEKVRTVSAVLDEDATMLENMAISFQI